MHYIVTHRNPNNTVVTGWQETRCESLDAVRYYTRCAKNYPGSCEVDSVHKVTAKGSTQIKV